MFGQGPSTEDIAEAHLACRNDESLKIDLVAALESLPAHYLEVVLLRDFAELTITEMAEKLGMQVPGVKSRLHRARELVREYLIGSTTAESRAAD
jgi:RNA polymerase sigma factor (sigma-70 family)